MGPTERGAMDEMQNPSDPADQPGPGIELQDDLGMAMMCGHLPYISFEMVIVIRKKEGGPAN